MGFAIETQYHILDTTRLLLIDGRQLFQQNLIRVHSAGDGSAASYQRFQSHVVFCRPEKLSMGTCFNLLRRVRISGAVTLCV